MKRITVLLAAMISLALLAPSSRAALIDFIAGDGSVIPGGDVAVPITVSGSAGQDWLSAQFTLQWDEDVLTFKVVDAQSPFSAGSLFNSTTPGILAFSWFSGEGAAVSDGATVFTVTFTAAENAALGSTPINFSMSATREVAFVNLTTITPDMIAGEVTVVPEPINWALGLFGCVFAGTAFVRWISLKRKSSPVG